MPTLQLIPAWYWLLCAGCFGALLGSFVNMAAYRLPRGISTVTRKRSFCPKCQAQLAWYENIPIFSYLALRGRCHHCKAPIPIRYLLTELLVCALFIAAAYQFFVLNDAIFVYASAPDGNPGFLFWRLLAVFIAQLFLIVDLVLLSVIDLETWTIPEVTTRSGVVLGIILALLFPELHAAATAWTGQINPSSTFYVRVDALLDCALGYIIGAGVLWAVGFYTTFLTFYYFRAKGSKERPKEGMGMGDVQLMGMIGVMLGWKAVLLTLFLGVFIGAISGVMKIGWDKIQQRRLGDKYKAWQPTYELPDEEGAAGPYTPNSILMFVLGLGICIGVGFLYDQIRHFSGILPMTWEERGSGLHTLAASAGFLFDPRLLPLALILLIGLSLLCAAIFFKYLTKIDMLPQGSIVENETGKKEEVLQGNYVPFGPSLALAALLVAFYDPLLREFAAWFVTGSMGAVPPPAYNVIGQATVLALLTGGARLLGQITQTFGGR